MALLKMKRDGKMVAVRLDREAVIVGSGPACNIKVPEGGLAQRHAQILRMNNGFVLRDLSGDVGTYVNGKKVKEHFLSDRDVIQMGQERFTYAEQEGQATARVAVSAAPPPTARTAAVQQAPTQRATVPVPPPAAPRQGGTARMVAVDPNRKTSTRAMPPASPPAAEAPAASSGKITSRTQKSGGTQRLNAATTRKMPGARTTGRIMKSTETFSMPKTKKGKLIAAVVAVGILGVGGIMAIAVMGKDKPEEIVADLKARVAELNKIDNPAKANQLADEILANPKYRMYGAETYRSVQKAKPALNQKAIDQRQADSDVLPFFQKYNVAKPDPEKMKTDADGLYDEAKSLADKYAGSSYAEKLKTIRDELKAYLEARKSAGDYTLALVTLGGKVETKVREGQCKEASGMVDEFGVKFSEKDNAELFNKLKDLRDRIKRGADEWVKKKNNEAQNLLKDGKKPDAIKLLEGARPGLEGFTAALEKLEAAIRAIRG